MSRSKLGRITVSDDVLVTCIAEETCNTEGVYGMFTGITGTLSKNIFGRDTDPSKGVRITRKNGKTIIDIYIFAKYRKKIPGLAWEIQTKIREKVKSITGVEVEEINIHVKGVKM